MKTNVRINDENMSFGCIFATIGMSVVFVSAWVRHVVWAIGTLAAADPAPTVGQVVLGALGTFVPPVGVIHGFMLFFGAGF